MCRRPAVSTISTSRAGVDGLAARFFRQTLDRRGVGFADFAFVDVGLDRLRHDFQLLAGRGTVDVDRDQQRPMAAILEPVCQLAGGRGLAGALQAGHEHDGRRLRGELHARGVAAESFDQLIAQDLDDLLARRKRGRHLLADGLFLNVVDELLYDFEVDVGFEQRQTDLAQRLLNVFFIEDGLRRAGS